VAVGIGDKYRAIDLATTSAAELQNPLPNNHDQAVEAGMAGCVKGSGYHQQASSTGQVKVAVNIGYLRVRVRTIRPRARASYRASEGLIGSICNHCYQIVKLLRIGPYSTELSSPTGIRAFIDH
jgi:hypothetical protein